MSLLFMVSHSLYMKFVSIKPGGWIVLLFTVGFSGLSYLKLPDL